MNFLHKFIKIKLHHNAQMPFLLIFMILMGSLLKKLAVSCYFTNIRLYPYKRQLAAKFSSPFLYVILSLLNSNAICFAIHYDL